MSVASLNQARETSDVTTKDSSGLMSYTDTILDHSLYDLSQVPGINLKGLLCSTQCFTVVLCNKHYKLGLTVFQSLFNINYKSKQFYMHA